MSDLLPPRPSPWIEVTSFIGGSGLALVRGPEPQQPIVLTSGTAARSPGHPPALVALPHGLTLGGAAELSTALALAVAHYDVDRARAIANRIDAVLEAEAEGRAVPLGPGLTRDWFETPVGSRSTTRRKPEPTTHVRQFGEPGIPPVTNSQGTPWDGPWSSR